MLAVGDAGALPYYSKWRHLDIYGLNDVNIAKNGPASLEYVEEIDPNLIILVSSNGVNPRGLVYEKSFYDFAIKYNYTKLSSIEFDYRYFLIPYLDPTVDRFLEIQAAIESIGIT